MKIYIRAESVVLEGYVNAVERNSKKLNERGVDFIERIAAGAFTRAIRRAKDIRILLNHARDLGGLKDGNLELEEDNIGLKVRAVITDPEVIEDARHGDLVGWSFGFKVFVVKQMRDEETGLPLRKVNDLELEEVSLLNRRKRPAYVGTLVTVRDDGSTEESIVNLAEDYNDGKIETVDETNTSALEDKGELNKTTEDDANTRDDQTDPEGNKPEDNKLSSEKLAGYKNIISELKSLVKEN